MKASKFSDAQKAFILKQRADGWPVADIGRRAGISEALVLQLEEEIRGPRPGLDATAEAAQG